MLSIAVLPLWGLGVQALAADAEDLRLRVAYDRTNGGVKAIVLAGDTNGMNWAEGTGTWGTIRCHSSHPSGSPSR